jgi:hypothetical protein
MPNKNIFALPASGALVSTDEMEKQVTANGQNQKLTLAQMLTFIQNNATAFALAINFGGNVGKGVLWGVVAVDGSAFFANGNFTVDPSGILTGPFWLINADGSCSFSGANFIIDVLGNVFASHDIEISDTAKGFILKSPNGTRYRLKVDNAGNLGTEPA